MKKRPFFIIALLALAITANAQMDNLSNMSAKWIGSNVRNASLDGGADMVNYNPAGLAMLDDGFYVSISNQMLFRHPQHTFNLGAGAVTFEQDGMDPFLPMVYAAWKKNKLALSTGVYISGGGAAVNYPTGSINTTLLGYQMVRAYAETAGYTGIKDQSLEASSFYLTVPIGISYPITKNLAVSVGARYLKGMNKTKAGLTLTGSEAAPDNALAIDYKSGATGFGGVIGVDFKASEKLNVAIHYETQVKMEFEATDNAGNFKLEPDGTKSRRDLPAALNTGLTYKLNDKLTGGFDFNYYFQKNADWGLVTNPLTGEKSEASEVAGDCYKMALGFNYLINDKLEFSIGSSYTFYNYEDMALYYTKMGPFEVLKYDNFNLGIGAGYNITKNIRFDLGIMRTFWKDQTIRALNAGVPPLMVDVNSSATVVALGLDFRF